MLPASPEVVAAYAAELMDDGKSMSTLNNGAKWYSFSPPRLLLFSINVTVNCSA